jgi:hypothetical protein
MAERLRVWTLSGRPMMNLCIAKWEVLSFYNSRYMIINNYVFQLKLNLEKRTIFTFTII